MKLKRGTLIKLKQGEYYSRFPIDSEFIGVRLIILNFLKRHVKNEIDLDFLCLKNGLCYKKQFFHKDEIVILAIEK